MCAQLLTSSGGSRQMSSFFFASCSFLHLLQLYSSSLPRSSSVQKAQRHELRFMCLECRRFSCAVVLLQLLLLLLVADELLPTGMSVVLATSEAHRISCEQNCYEFSHSFFNVVLQYLTNV